MSKKNKVVKLGSKTRDKGKSYLVTYNGQEMTRAEREALIRAGQTKTEPAPVKKAAKKGTKVAEPRFSKLFNMLHPKKKQTVAPDIKSVENTAPVVEKKVWEEKKEEKPVVTPEPVVEPVVEEVKEEVVEPAPEPVVEPVVEPTPEPEPAPEPVAEPVAEPEPEPVAEPEPVEEEEEEEDFEDDLTQGITKKNAKKRISPAFVKRVGTTSAKGCDECILGKKEIEKRLAEVEAEIAKAKTPKTATEEEKAALNDKRKALRADKKQIEKELEISVQKAIALERAADGYSDIYKLLTGNELSVRKTERINEYHSLTDEQEQEVLNSLWANKGAHK